MTSSELNEYLNKHLVDIRLGSNRSFFVNLDKTLNESNMEEYLKKDYQYIERQNAETLLFHLQFGRLLNTKFSILQNAKKEGKIQGNWDDWIRDKAGICTSFARKLRDSVFIINPVVYPQFLRLGLSFSEIYPMKKQNQEMLNETHISEQWKKDMHT